ncbi:MAG TPA: type VI secretion system baseplate subunit TssG [Gemmatimonadaceae bacterium]
MDAKLGREADALTFLSALAGEPYRYDFYQTLRRLECLYQEKPRWGTALRPADEPVRLGQDPDLAFAPAPLASFEFGKDGGRPRLQVRLFGLLGPNGPLPIHITEYARHRLRHAGDPTLSRFLDIFHHRFLALFYRAWAQAQPHVNRDRAEEDRYVIYVGSFLGIAPPQARQRDTVPDLAKLFHAGTLVRQVRNADGLAAIVRQFFRVPVRIEQFVGHWLFLAPRDRTYLRRDGKSLAVGAVLGARVWDHQSKFRIHLGPLTLKQYEAFLPATRTAGPGTGRTGTLLEKLVDWVRFYLCFELDWDLRLHLKRDEVPALKIGVQGQLGWTTWLGARPAASDAADLYLNAEAFVDRTRAA